MAKWHRDRSGNDRTYAEIGLNFINAKKSIPKTSTAHTAILKIASQGIIISLYIIMCFNNYFYCLITIITKINIIVMICVVLD